MTDIFQSHSYNLIQHFFMVNFFHDKFSNLKKGDELNLAQNYFSIKIMFIAFKFIIGNNPIYYLDLSSVTAQTIVSTSPRYFNHLKNIS